MRKILPLLQLDQKKRNEWYVMSAKGDYQELAKLASDEPRLAKLKVSFFTVYVTKLRGRCCNVKADYLSIKPTFLSSKIR